ncbi:hypothetical protein BDK51DRAFT_35340 [Blyttiomyces helicus]|uniref:F-box domain-containing protein n=1 Tax=Blyttiomyces helicus TaxID=388810 RepID=A0A4P9WE71_9FUNG|nr:hypothetical protein BDK51DRAFT_35340 [Blyttiomyces helicus]|eukprot:RKO88676.1 hypothetical protein BDK51DRAFT_35340 [Blyttiomyces helicus]
MAPTPTRPTLSTLPRDTLLPVLHHLAHETPPRSLLRLARTCRLFHTLADDNLLWRECFSQRFDPPAVSAGPWRERYVQRYLALDAAISKESWVVERVPVVLDALVELLHEDAGKNILILSTPRLVHELSVIFMSVWPEVLADAPREEQWSGRALFEVMSAGLNADFALHPIISERHRAFTSELGKFLDGIPEKYQRRFSVDLRLSGSMTQLAMLRLLLSTREALLRAPPPDEVPRQIMIRELHAQYPLRPRTYRLDVSLLGGWRGWFAVAGGAPHNCKLAPPMRITLTEVTPHDGGLRFRGTGVEAEAEDEAGNKFEITGGIDRHSGQVAMAKRYLATGRMLPHIGALTPFGFAGHVRRWTVIGLFWMWKEQGEVGGPEWEAGAITL